MSAGPFSIGSNVWPGISKMIEESAEVLQVTGKLMGTGGAVDHWDGSNLRERLQEEIADAQAAQQFVIETNGLDHSAITNRFREKLELFRRWHREQA